MSKIYMHLRLFHEYKNESLHVDSDKLNIKTHRTNNTNRLTIIRNYTNDNQNLSIDKQR